MVAIVLKFSFELGVYSFVGGICFVLEVGDGFLVCGEVVPEGGGGFHMF